MTDTLTPEKREEIRKRAEAATPGPWRRQTHGGDSTVLCLSAPSRVDAIVSTYGYRQDGEYCIAYPFTDEEGDFRRDFVCFSHDDASFIAHAREDIPALLSALEAANKRADEAEALVRLLEDDETVTIITALRARVAELEGALRWVSDWINYELPVPTRNATTALGVVLDTLAGRDNAALKEKNDGQG